MGETYVLQKMTINWPMGKCCTYTAIPVDNTSMVMLFSSNIKNRRGIKVSAVHPLLVETLQKQRCVWNPGCASTYEGNRSQYHNFSLTYTIRLTCIDCGRRVQYGNGGDEQITSEHYLNTTSTLSTIYYWLHIRRCQLQCSLYENFGCRGVAWNISNSTDLYLWLMCNATIKNWCLQKQERSCEKC